MCGICGELTFEAGAAVRRETLVAMRDRLVHRGPDDEGLFVGDGGRVGLGFRRLRIIDLTAVANQPMSNEDGSVWVAFNGEIYNFRDLRARLVALGHRFRSQSDTETIVHLYEERGPRFVDDLDGMFAIALWDGRTRRLVLARDRAGKKPLFYFQDRRRCVFGSEIKALFAHPDVPIEIDETQVPLYFLHGYVPHPASLYRGVRQVDPATAMVIESDGRTESRRYWQLRFAGAGNPLNVDRRTARDQVRQLVTAAVARRLVSDVPLGAFLSGGIDSTIVVGVMSQLTAAPVKTFTIGFDDAPAFDETGPARTLADTFHTEHTEFRVRPSAVQLIDRLIWHHDGPFGDSSAIPTFLVSELTRQHVTVVLTGDGGDELFAGYLRFRAALAADRLAGRYPSAPGRGARDPSAGAARTPSARAGTTVRPFHASAAGRAAGSLEQHLSGRSRVASPDVAGVDPIAHLKRALDESRAASPLSQLLAVNYASYLPDDLLVKTDRCTMANSIEARVSAARYGVDRICGVAPRQLQARRWPRQGDSAGSVCRSDSAGHRSPSEDGLWRARSTPGSGASFATMSATCC